jgi:hypothetical protein
MIAQDLRERMISRERAHSVYAYEDAVQEDTPPRQPNTRDQEKVEGSEGCPPA